jgi:hypothetical protein
MHNWFEEFLMGIYRGFLRLVFLCSMSILLFGLLPVTGGAGMAFDLEAYKWKNRIILVFAPSFDSDAYKRQMQEFEGQEEGLLDRDLIILELLENGESRWGDTSLSARVAQQMRSQFNVGEGEFLLLLIGKDGTVKLRSNHPVSTFKLFGLIDAMPMRQEEMRRKQSSTR